MKIEPSFWKPGVQPETITPAGGLKPLTVCYVTSREKPMLEWFLDSLHTQINDWEHVEVIVVDSRLDLSGSEFDGENALYALKPPNYPKLKRCLFTKPKPSIWQGEHRLTDCDWWDVSNARNTGIALCRTEWIAHVDDRCVLMPTWLQSIREAMSNGYAVCGSYEKRHNMTVQNGVIMNGGNVTGRDNRDRNREPWPIVADGNYWYGCTTALPLEWALAVNGYSEDICGGLGFEDIPFGMTLRHNGFPIRFDTRFKIIEDRTPSELGTVMKRSDYGVSPNDKSHEVLKKLKQSPTSLNSYNLRDLREKVLKGEPFPMPTAAHNEWFTGRPISSL